MKFSHKFSKQTLLFFCVLIAVIAVSLSTLTTFPRIFYDEGLTIEIARNFQLFGILDISTAPGEFTNVPYITGSNGFPVTMPLALFFRLFGFGLVQARIYALLWLIILFFAVYLFTKRFWGSNHALSAVLLVATFAPLYDNGRRVLGEIPGFVFLLAGLFILITRDKSLAAGVFFGLATVSKPSIYLLIAPSLIIAALFINRGLRKKIFPILAGMSPALILWILLAFPDPLSMNTWKNVSLLYQNPFASASLFGNFIHNISLFLSQTTLIYFSLIAIFIAWVLNSFRQPIRTDLFLSFLTPYGVLLLLYFLRSPGWLKYLLPLELFILMILPAHIKLGLVKLGRSGYYPTIIAALVILQGIQLLFFSNITSATSEPEDIANYLSRRPGMVGILNSPQIASLIPAERKLHYVTFVNNLAIVGYNSLDLPRLELPRFLVMPSGFENSGLFSKEQKENFKYYKLIKGDEWKVFELP